MVFVSPGENMFLVLFHIAQGLIINLLQNVCLWYENLLTNKPPLDYIPPQKGIISIHRNQMANQELSPFTLLE